MRGMTGDVLRLGSQSASSLLINMQRQSIRRKLGVIGIHVCGTLASL